MRMRELAGDARLRPLTYCFLVALSLGLLAGIFTPTKLAVSVSIALSFFFYLILPGYLVIINLRLDTLERVILAMPVSMAIVPLALYFLNIAGMRISAVNIIVTIAALSLVAAWFNLMRKPATQQKNDARG